MSEKAIAIANQPGGVQVATVDAAATAAGLARVMQLTSTAYKPAVFSSVVIEPVATHELLSSYRNISSVSGTFLEAKLNLSQSRLFVECVEDDYSLGGFQVDLVWNVGDTYTINFLVGGNVVATGTADAGYIVVEVVSSIAATPVRVWANLVFSSAPVAGDAGTCSLQLAYAYEGRISCKDGSLLCITPQLFGDEPPSVAKFVSVELLVLGYTTGLYALSDGDAPFDVLALPVRVITLTREDLIYTFEGQPESGDGSVGYFEPILIPSLGLSAVHVRMLSSDLGPDDDVSIDVQIAAI